MPSRSSVLSSFLRVPGVNYLGGFPPVRPNAPCYGMGRRHRSSTSARLLVCWLVFFRKLNIENTNPTR